MSARDQETVRYIPDLAAFAEMPLAAMGNLKLGDLVFASAEDKWSTAFMPLSTLTLPAGSQASLFNESIGNSTGIGSTKFTIAETNSKGGVKQAGNQVYVATHAGFQLYAVSTTSLAPIPIENPLTIQQLGLNMAWSLNIADTIDRFIGTVLEYPAGSGAWGGISIGSGSTAAASPYAAWANNGAPDCQKRRLRIPIVFPPNLNTEIAVVTGAAVTLTDNTTVGGGATFTGGNIAVRCTFQGYRMTAPVAM